MYLLYRKKQIMSGSPRRSSSRDRAPLAALGPTDPLAFMQSKINPSAAPRDAPNAPWTREQVQTIKELTVDTAAADYVKHLSEYTGSGGDITIHFPALQNKLEFVTDHAEIVEDLANHSHHVAQEFATVFVSGIQTNDTDTTVVRAWNTYNDTIKNMNVGAKMIYNKSNLIEKVKVYLVLRLVFTMPDPPAVIPPQHGKPQAAPPKRDIVAAGLPDAVNARLEELEARFADSKPEVTQPGATLDPRTARPNMDVLERVLGAFGDAGDDAFAQLMRQEGVTR